MEARKICLRSDGLELAGEVYIPSESKVCPALCICHGIPASPYNPEDRGYAALAQKFCAAGFATLIFNFRGTGESQGNLGILGWSRDLGAAIDFLCHLEKIDKTRLCLLGFSGGAAVSVYVAAHDTRISSLVACACPADFGSLSGKETAPSAIQHFRDIGVIRDNNFPPSIEGWLRGFEVISPIHWIDKISPRPLLLVHGDADEVVPLEQADKLYQKAREPKELAIIPGAKHKLRLEETAMVTVLNWLKASCSTDLVQIDG
jgi:dipeptidyl aminopeptidase/acylaminoacyl peptidase